MHPSLPVNLANWEERVPAHAASPDYGLADFAADPAHLSGVVRFDLPRLGQLSGLDVVHLQCHIGTDTVSLARLGARVVGLDFSPAAIAQARELAEHIGTDAEFVQAEVYDAVAALGAARFDLVYTGIGALCWLPDIAAWARVIGHLLRPGGRLFLREGHPMLWTLDDPDESHELRVRFPYFEQAEPTVFDEPGTYVTTDASFQTTITHEWNHGLGELVTALLDTGLVLTMLVEHDSAPWEALPGMMSRASDGEWRLTDRPERLPLTYTLQARKPAA
jgi:SAM-dependent methyltransferase